MDGSIDFQPYLSSICYDYAEWWKLYTLTEIEGRSAGSSIQNKRVASFDFGLMMQSINTGKPEALHQERPEKTERRSVLDGLRQSLTEAKHVLLIGRPGSGKSTTLARLLLEEAQQSQGGTGEKRIPVLVELRSYKTSVLDLIQDFFRRHDLVLTIHQVETLLSQNYLLLLVDGLNELPSEAARQDIVKLRNYRRVPIIFTTRDLSLGGDFGIEKQWEMLPLTELQMQEFIKLHLSPEQADAMWRQLQGRTRKFAETPLLLWMLCELFGQVEAIPHNLGEVFRVFTRAYENNSVRKHEVAALKGDVQPLSDRRLWFPALKHLAYLMMQGETPVDSRTVISRQEAETELRALFREEPYPSKTARDCLDDLLHHHFLQNRTANEVEFHHQLFQEYYAAEWLLQRLPDLTDEQLKYYFLNYLKWTEAIKLLLGFIQHKAEAVQVVRAALEVDGMMAIHLTKRLEIDFHKYSSTLPGILGRFHQLTLKIAQEEYPTVYIGRVRRRGLLIDPVVKNSSIPALLKTLEDSDDSVSWFAAMVLSRIDCKDKRSTLFLNLENLALDSQNSSARCKAIFVLGKIGNERTISTLSKTIKDSDSSVRRASIEALEDIGCEQVLPILIEAWKDKNNISSILSAFQGISSSRVVPFLIEALNSSKICDMSDYSHYTQKIIQALHTIRDPRALPKLSELRFSDDFFHVDSAIRVIQNHCGFYNYEISQSPSPSINFGRLSANNSPTHISYIFQTPVGNVAHTVHGNQITNQQKDLKEKE